MARPRAVIFVGPPGSGKTTQAEYLKERFGDYEHLNIGRVIEQLLKDSRDQEDTEIRHERERFEKGLLATSPFVIRIAKDTITKIQQRGHGVVLSGNPRTLEEAEFLIPFLKELYESEAIVVFHIRVPSEVSIFRNTKRRVCSTCGIPLVPKKDEMTPKMCPHCNGELVRRSLDNEDTIQERLKVYHFSTEPILRYFQTHAVPIIDIDGSADSETIRKLIEKEFDTLAT